MKDPSKKLYPKALKARSNSKLEGGWSHLGNIASGNCTGPRRMHNTARRFVFRFNWFNGSRNRLEYDFCCCDAQMLLELFALARKIPSCFERLFPAWLKVYRW